jgi:hypothetical protein
MSFVKLDTGILDSTLWVARDPREVFITALLMAMPREFDEPMQAYKPGSLETYGFVVPPGWYGFVEASGPGIVRRAGVPADSGMEALQQLCEPDPESRSSEWEGRRMVRVNGGYVILNFMKYRDKDNSAAERARRYRERQKDLASRETSRVTRDVDAVTRDSSLAESEAESEKSVIPIKLSLDSPPADADGLDFVGHKLNGHAPKTVPDCPHAELLALWAEVMPDLPQHDPSLWPESARATNLRARWRSTAALKGWATKDEGLAYFRKLFQWCRRSDFLMGKAQSRDRRPFQFELAWLVNATNWTKVHEGKFNE